MRIASLLVLGLAALATPTDAIRSAASTLARLSHRVADAEASLAQSKSSSSLALTHSHTHGHQMELQPYATPNSQYSFDYSTYADTFNTAKSGTVTPTTATNIAFAYDSSRGGMVAVRNPSKSNAAAVLKFPNQLSSSFTLGFWINWNGVSTGSENHVLDSSDGSFQFYLDGNGYYNAIVNGVKQTDSQPINALTWVFYAIVVDRSKQTLTVFRGDQLNANTKIGTVTATYPGTASSLVFGNYGPAPCATKGWYGYIDLISIYNYALDDSTVTDLWWGTNIGATPTGQAPTAPGPYSYYGHFGVSQVTFSNRYAGQSAGDWSITLALSDIGAAVGDDIRIRMYGCTGTDATVTLADGTTVTYIASVGLVCLKPGTAIPMGTTKTYSISGSQIDVTNPTTSYATASDPNWKIGIIFSSKQISQTGLRYEGIRNTPATLNPNPSLL